MPDDNELECLGRIYTAFAEMQNDAARDRALTWLKDRHDWDQEKRRRAGQPAA